MRTDIEPNRLLAAEAAALSFIQRQGANTQIGLVAFAGFAELIQPPTSDQEVLQDAVESLFTGRRTAIGSGILEALDAIAEIDPNIAPSETGKATDVKPTPVPKGAYAPHIIVLLTDGVSNAGPQPTDAAQQAVDRGIRVYTIGFGTANNLRGLRAIRAVNPSTAVSSLAEAVSSAAGSSVEAAGLVAVGSGGGSMKRR